MLQKRQVKPTSNQWRGRSIASDEDGPKSRDHPSLNGSTIPQCKNIDLYRDMECQITLPNGIPHAKAKGLRWLSTIDLLKLASKPTSKLASKALIGWEPVSDRIVSAWFRTWQAKITFIQDYAPTEEGERYNQGCLLQPAPRLFSSHSVARSPVNG